MKNSKHFCFCDFFYELFISIINYMHRPLNKCNGVITFITLKH